MKNKVPKNLDKYILQLIEIFRFRMGLHRFNITYKWIPRVSNPRTIKHKSNEYETEGYSAEVDIDTIYFTIHFFLSITKFKKHWRDMNYYAIADTVCHELAHQYTEELYTMLYDKTETNDEKEALRRLNEKTVSNITTVIMGSLGQDIWMPKDF